MSRGFPQELLKATLGMSPLLSSMERSKVLQTNKQLEQAGALYLQSNQLPILLPRTSVNPYCRVAIAKSQIPQLKKTHLSELQMDTCSQGRILQGLLRGTAFKLDRIVVTALEDVSGRVARLMLQNVIEVATPPEQIQFRYPEGAQVTITEPCLVSEVLGIEGPTLWVTNPGTFQVVSRFPDLKTQDCDILNLANDNLSNGNFWAAVDLYTRSIEIKESVFALCKRAEAYLKLGFNIKALEDAVKAMTMEPRHVGSILVKARTWMALRHYKNAVECFKLAMELSPGDPTICASYEECNKFYHQSRHGFPEISSVAALDKVTPYPDYVGPVEVKMTPGKGRGLFTTAPVAKGQLLLAHNATVAHDGTDIRGPDFLARLVSSCQACPLTFARVRGMFEMECVPCMEVFRPNWDLDRLLPELKLHEENVGLDVAGLEWLVTRSVSICYGIWTLPAFLNHSCLPNVTCGGLGKVQYVYAARDLEAGAELLTSYWSVLRPWNTFRRKCPETFSCSCERCLLEERLEEPLEDVCKRFQEIVDATGRSLTTELMEVAVEVEKKLRKMLDLNHKEKQWLRASFSQAYLAFYQKTGPRMSMELEMPSVENFLDALHETAPGNGNDQTLELILGCVATLSGYDYDEKRLQHLLQQEKFLRYGEENL